MQRINSEAEGKNWALWQKVTTGPFIVAEIGKNFIQTEDERSVGEYLENAKALVDAAVEAGADAVKFQTHEVEDEQLDVEVVSPHFRASDRMSWIRRNVKATPLTEFWIPLKQYCDKRGVVFFSTPMSRKAAYKLDRVGVPFWKVGSGDVQDYVTLDFLIETGKPIIISSGMVSLDELDRVIKHITGRGSPLAVLYCVSQYPCPLEHFNLATIELLREKYPDVVFGFSDHSVGNHTVDLAAIKLGAKIIEKHFSVGRDLWGADHKVSMTPAELRKMVEAIRNGESDSVDPMLYYGSKNKELEGAKNIFRPYFNKSLVAGINISEGAVIAKEMVFAMRPQMHAKGLPADRFYDVVGRRTSKALEKFGVITEDILV